MKRRLRSKLLQSRALGPLRLGENEDRTHALYSEEFNFLPLARVCDHVHVHGERKPFLCSNGAVMSADIEERTPPSQLALCISEAIGHAVIAFSPYLADLAAGSRLPCLARCRRTGAGGRRVRTAHCADGIACT